MISVLEMSAKNININFWLSLLKVINTKKRSTCHVLSTDAKLEYMLIHIYVVFFNKTIYQKNIKLRQP